MLINNRIIWSDNGVLKDQSVVLNNYHSGTITLPLVAAEDAIYIGSDLPWNHRYIEVYSPNAISSTMSIQIWNGREFKNAVDVIDQTKASGGSATLAQSGILSFAPDRNESGWGLAATTENVTGLTSLKIYNLYWAKLTVSSDLTASTALSFVGHKFSFDEELDSIYPELGLSSSKTQFESGKTDWNEQHIRAAEILIRDLRRKIDVDYNFRNGNQILEWGQFSECSLHQVAMIVYRAFGDAFKDQFEQATKDYHTVLNGLVKGILVDRNRDGRVQLDEQDTISGLVRR